MLERTVSFLGIKSGYGDPSEDDFPADSFGFFLRVSHFFGDETLYFCINTGILGLRALSLDDNKGGIEFGPPQPLDP